MSEIKGPNAFGKNKNDFSRKFNTKNKEAYLKLFKGTENYPIKGEASHYFFDEKAIKEIKAFNPKAKILIVIRNPVDIIKSHYSYDPQHRIEGGSTIIKAIKNFSNYSAGRDLKEILRYTHYIKLWQQHFGKKQVYVVEFDELMSNLPREFSRICEWLGIDGQFQPRFLKHNPSRKFDEEKLKEAIKRTNRIPVGLRVFLKKILPRGTQEKIKGKITDSVTIEEGGVQIGLKTKKYIINNYSSEIGDLEKLLKKDLSKWKNK